GRLDGSPGGRLPEEGVLYDVVAAGELDLAGPRDVQVVVVAQEGVVGEELLGERGGGGDGDGRREGGGDEAPRGVSSHAQKLGLKRKASRAPSLPQATSKRTRVASWVLKRRPIPPSVRNWSRGSSVVAATAPRSRKRASSIEGEASQRYSAWNRASFSPRNRWLSK